MFKGLSANAMASMESRQLQRTFKTSHYGDNGFLPYCTEGVYANLRN